MFVAGILPPMLLNIMLLGVLKFCQLVMATKEQKYAYRKRQVPSAKNVLLLMPTISESICE
jgi:hypothetical protein